VAMFVSTIPSNSPCDAGGSSVIYKINACSGGRTSYPVFDVDDDGDIDDNDVIILLGVPVSVSAMKVPKGLLPPLTVGDKDIFPDTGGGRDPLPNVPPQQGMFYWRILGQ